MQAQLHPRYKKRIPCAFDDDQGQHLAMVLNVSQGGLFVSSRVMPRVGSKVVLHLSAEDPGLGSESIATRVVWKRRHHRAASVLGDGGIGLAIEQSSDAYDCLLKKLAPARLERSSQTAVADEASSLSTGSLPSFCVRVAWIGSPRTRTLEISAADENQASVRARHLLGRDWQVIGVHPIAVATKPETCENSPGSD